MPQRVHEGASFSISPDGRLLAGVSRYATSVTELSSGVVRAVWEQDLGYDAYVDVRWLGAEVLGSCISDGSTDGCTWWVQDLEHDVSVSVSGAFSAVTPVLLGSPPRIATFGFIDTATLEITPLDGTPPIITPLDESRFGYPAQLVASPDGRTLAIVTDYGHLLLADAATGIVREVGARPLQPGAVSDEEVPTVTLFYGFSQHGALALFADANLVVIEPTGLRVLAAGCYEYYTPFPDRAALGCGDAARPLWLDLATATLRPRAPTDEVEPPYVDPTGTERLYEPVIAALTDRISAAREHSTWSVGVDGGVIRVQHREFADALDSRGWTRLWEPAPDAYGSSYGDYSYSTSYDTDSYGDTASGYEDTSAGYDETATEYDETATGEGEGADLGPVEEEPEEPVDPDADYDESPDVHYGEPCWIGRGSGVLEVWVRGAYDADIQYFALEGSEGAYASQASVDTGCEIAAVVAGASTRLYAWGSADDPTYSFTHEVPGAWRVVWSDPSGAVLADPENGFRLYDAVTGRLWPMPAPSGSCFFIARTGSGIVLRTDAGLATVAAATGETRTGSVADTTSCGLVLDQDLLVARSGPTLATLDVYALPGLDRVSSYEVPTDAVVSGGHVIRCTEGLEVRDVRTGTVLRAAESCPGTLATDSRFFVVASESRGRAVLERVVDGARIEIVMLQGNEESVAVYSDDGALWVPEPALLAHYALRMPGSVLTAPMIYGAELERRHYRPTLLADFLEGRPLPLPGEPPAPPAR